jgi:hypothetical protein
LLVDLAKERLILPDSSLPLVHADEEYEHGRAQCGMLFGR